MSAGIAVQQYEHSDVHVHYESIEESHGSVSLSYTFIVLTILFYVRLIFSKSVLLSPRLLRAGSRTRLFILLLKGI